MSSASILKESRIVYSYLKWKFWICNPSVHMSSLSSQERSQMQRIFIFLEVTYFCNYSWSKWSKLSHWWPKPRVQACKWFCGAEEGCVRATAAGCAVFPPPWLWPQVLLTISDTMWLWPWIQPLGKSWAELWTLCSSWVPRDVNLCPACLIASGPSPFLAEQTHSFNFLTGSKKNSGLHPHYRKYFKKPHNSHKNTTQW